MSRRVEYARLSTGNGNSLNETKPQGFRHAIILGAVLTIGIIGWFALPARVQPIVYSKAVAVLGGNGTVQGTIYFEQENGIGHVKISGEIKHLTPDSARGFHIHEGGDVTNGCLSTGAHYNPDGHTHGAPTDRIRHVGDLGNINSDGSGVATVSIEDKLLSLNGPRSIIGRSVVVHEGTDDYGLGGHSDSLTTGHAGGRAACGIVGLIPT